MLPPNQDPADFSRYKSPYGVKGIEALSCGKCDFITTIEHELQEHRTSTGHKKPGFLSTFVQFIKELPSLYILPIQRKRKIFGGVCVGIAETLHISPTLVRIIFIVLLAFAVVPALAIYLLLWLVMKFRPFDNG